LVSINIGTLTGRSRELADLLRRRRVDVACIQETKWKGSKARDIGDGYKLLYYGTRSDRNGVAIAVAEDLRDKITQVERLTDRLMAVSIDTGHTTIRVVSAYAPQTGCCEEDKDAFWLALDEYISTIPQDQVLLLGADFNGHVGEERGDSGQCHGGHGYGTRNNEGERILDFASAHDLILANTYYIKRDSHLVTYASGDRQTQVDYWTVRRCHLKHVKDCKVIPGESLLPQHRLLLLEMGLPINRQRRLTHGETKARIKWWKLATKNAGSALAACLPALDQGIEETWTELTERVHKEATKLLGVTKPGRRRIEKETWWWNEDVQAVIRDKKTAYKQWQATRKAEDRLAYLEAKREAKRKVKEAKQADISDLYSRLNTREGAREIYRLAKRRAAATKDMGHFYQMKDEQGRPLRRPKEICERWRAYFEKISNEEFDHPAIPQEPPVEGPIANITAAEVQLAIAGMKNGKATGPDDIPGEFWKICGQTGATWLAEMFNQMVQLKTMPQAWSTSTTVPIWKNKGDIADCANYRPIRLMSHTLKIFERVIDRRLRAQLQITANQCGFVKGASTTDAIHAARLLMEKHREKNKPLHAAFLDLEKAFDRVPHEVIWWALRKHNVPEEYVEWIKLIYRGATTNVRSTAGVSKDFPITVGVHQGSALSPLLFITVMDAITQDIQKPHPWTLLYADDVALMAPTRQELELDVQRWKDRLQQYGLRLNIKKTEYMEVGHQTPGTINAGEPLEKTTCFRYLGSRLAAEGGTQEDVTARINAAWMKWREITGVLCDKKMPLHLKSKVYRTVVRPVALYGAECWPTTKKDEARLSVMEMRMLRWTLGVTRLDRIPNDTIRQAITVAPITDKLKETRLRWYGHVRRREEDHLAKRVMSLEVEGKRSRGRPKFRWLDKIKVDLKESGLTDQDALDRAKWKRMTRTADPTT
jgi:hypothetical protein